MNKEKLKKKKGYSFLKKYLTKEVIIIILGMILVGVIGLSIGLISFLLVKQQN